MRKARGIRGEITAVTFGSRPERFEELKEVFLFGPADDNSNRRVRIEEVWEHKGLLVVKLEGVDTRNDAEKLQGYELRIPISERPPAPEGEFYHSDLMGCEVFDRGVSIGRVVDWSDFGGSGLLVVEGPKGEVMIPFAKEICKEIDVASKRILTELPEGLLEQ